MKQVLELGGFRVETLKRGKQEWMRISAKSENWKMTLRNDNVVYQVIKEMLNQGYTEYVHSYVMLNYSMASVTPDLEFMEGFIKLQNDYAQRVVSPTLSEVSEEESLEEVKSTLIK